MRRSYDHKFETVPMSRGTIASRERGILLEDVEALIVPVNLLKELANVESLQRLHSDLMVI